VRPAVKRLVENLLVSSGVATLARRRLGGRTLVLAYHNVLPDGESAVGDLSLHLPRREFAGQLDALGETHDVVPITALAETPARAKRPRVVITFDDAYAGALTCGVDELVARGMPATIFVAPDLLGSVTWWDQLAAHSGGIIADDVRKRALGPLGGRTGKILEGGTAVSRALASPVSSARIGTESQLLKAAARPGISIGSHSWSHPNLSSLDPASLDAELARPRQWLEGRFPRAVPWVSYPYGMFTETVERAAERAGYRGAFRIDGGWMPDSPRALYAMPRLNIPSGLSINGFRLRLAGL